MASGDVAHAPAVRAENLPTGSVVTGSGRVSGVRLAGDPVMSLPFPIADLVRLDDALTYGTRAAKVHFTVHLGELGPKPRERARELFASLASPAQAVLIAVSPSERTVEILSGSGVADRITDRVAQLGVTAAVASFGERELIDGLVSAIRVMTAAVKPPA